MRFKLPHEKTQRTEWCIRTYMKKLAGTARLSGGCSRRRDGRLGWADSLSHGGQFNGCVRFTPEFREELIGHPLRNEKFRIFDYLSLSFISIHHMPISRVV